MITRRQYLDGDFNHHQYYGQFVSASVKMLVMSNIGKDKLLASKGTHFNDIPLRVWDSLTFSLPYDIVRVLKGNGDKFSIYSGVCILKEAARMIKEKELNSKTPMGCGKISFS